MKSAKPLTVRAVVFVPAVFICSLGLLGGAALGKRMATSGPTDDYSFFDELVEVKQLISQRYVDAPDQAKLREGAIKGMVEALGDPYTVYVPASEQRNFNKDLTGEYVGIGATVNQVDGWLTIISPMEDSPAFRAGLMADDRVIEVNGVTTHNVHVNDCIDMLLGEPGTKVSLLIERKGERKTIEITRERIKARAVKGFHRSQKDQNAWDHVIDPARGIAYVRLNQFTPGSTQEVLAALKSAGVESGGLKGLILDLRFNPGGLLREAEELADLFLESGVIVSTRGRAYEEVVRRAQKSGTLPDFPIAILLNGSSASASEVLAGALVENNRAIVVGTRSFGKGSVQQVMELPSGRGSELKLTEQGYFLPSGRSLSRKDDAAAWGVDPTDGFYVPMTDEETIAMLEVRRQQEVLHAAGGAPASGDWGNPDWVLDTLKDRQLAAAVRGMQGKIDAGEWTRTGEAGADAQGTAIAMSELTKLREFQSRLLRELGRTEQRMDAIERADPKAQAQAEALRDFWPDATDLKGGVLEIRDKDGKVIATLDITGNNIEQWLIDADVKKQSQPQ